ncbi:NADH-quinone oxidoreductase subunit H [Thalassiella azotivora]
MRGGAVLGTSPEAWGLAPAVALVLAAAVALGATTVVADSLARGSGATAPAREAARLLLTQPRRTLRPDVLLLRVGVVAVPVLALLAVAVVPVGGRTLVSTSADLVWFNAAEALLWAAVWLVGWGPNAFHSLVGAYRFLAQGLAYELPLMFTIITAGVAAGSLRTTDVVAAQGEGWFVVTMPVAFVVFMVCSAAFAFWGPFAAPGAVDAAGGVLSDLSGADRLLVHLGRYVFLGAAAAMGAALFLGGGDGPWWPGPVWHVLKTLAVLAALVLLGHRVPLVRPDRFVEVAWMVLVPATILQALVVSVLALSGVY